MVKITKRENKWIDDVLTSPTVTPYAAAIMLTDSTRFPVNASDHNGVLPRYSPLLLPDRPSDDPQVLDRLLSDPPHDVEHILALIQTVVAEIPSSRSLGNPTHPAPLACRPPDSPEHIRR
jgi:hypothetical protein